MLQLGQSGCFTAEQLDERASWASSALLGSRRHGCWASGISVKWMIRYPEILLSASSERQPQDDPNIFVARVWDLCWSDTKRQQTTFTRGHRGLDGCVKQSMFLSGILGLSFSACTAHMGFGVLAVQLFSGFLPQQRWWECGSDGVCVQWWTGEGSRLFLPLSLSLSLAGKSSRNPEPGWGTAKC